MSSSTHLYSENETAVFNLAQALDYEVLDAPLRSSASAISTLSKLDLFRLLHDVARILTRRWDKELRATIPKMNAPRATIILQLGQSGGASQTRLARLLGLSQMTVSRLLDDLEHLGWVRREAVPADRRRWAARLTDEGRRVLITVHRVAHAFVERSCAGMDEQRRAAFVATLSALEFGTRPARPAAPQTTSHIV